MDKDEFYLKVWETEQEHTKIRWTVYTFFASVSFAIFGLSFQSNPNYSIQSIMRFSGMVIYWFAFLLFQRFYFYTLFLRNYLEVLATSSDFDIEGKKRAFYKTEGFGKHLTDRRLLLSLGILYTIVVVVLYAAKI